MPSGREDVLAVVPAARESGTWRPERIAERCRAVDREDVAAARELGRDLGRGPHELGRARPGSTCPAHAARRAGSRDGPGSASSSGFVGSSGWRVPPAPRSQQLVIEPISIDAPGEAVRRVARSASRGAPVTRRARRARLHPASTLDLRAEQLERSPVRERDHRVGRGRDELAEDGQRRRATTPTTLTDALAEPAATLARRSMESIVISPPKSETTSAPTDAWRSTRRWAARRPGRPPTRSGAIEPSSDRRSRRRPARAAGGALRASETSSARPG